MTEEYRFYMSYHIFFYSLQYIIYLNLLLKNKKC